jgi:hypothetical protein
MYKKAIMKSNFLNARKMKQRRVGKVSKSNRGDVCDQNEL